MRACYTIYEKVWQYMHLEHTFISSHEWAKLNRWAKFCILCTPTLMSVQHKYQLDIDDAALVVVVVVYRKQNRGPTSCKEHLVTELNVILFIYFVIFLILLLVYLMFIKEFYEVFEWNSILLAHFHIHSNVPMQGHVPFIHYLSIFSILFDFVVWIGCIHFESVNGEWRMANERRKRMKYKRANNWILNATRA